MRRTLLLAALLALALPSLAGADPPRYGIVRPASERGLSPRELGKQLYAGNCSLCHGSNGEGSQKGPSLRGKGARAADFYLRTGYMPLRTPGIEPARSRVLFSEREIRALVGYVGSFGGPPVPRPHPERGSLSRGLKLFTEHCAGCHQVVAQGGFVTGARVPPLEAATAVQVAEAVRTGPYYMPRFSRKAISDRRLDDIVAYVQWTKNADHRGGWPLGYVGPLPEGLVTWFVALAVLVATCIVIGKRLRSS
ncbi:MAG TPA: c-type cytochrome [Gaiellaceae bacterium]